MAEPTGFFLFLSKCTGADFAAGVVGNLVAAVGYDHLLKPGIAASLTQLRQMTAAGVTQENHDLLRAIWVAQNQALVLACEAVLTSDKRLRPGSLAIPQDINDLDAWLSSETDAEVKLLLRLRAEALRAARRSNKADLEIIQRSLAATVDDVPALLKAGAEIDTQPNGATEDFLELRTRVTENFIVHLGATLPYGPVLPAALERTLKAHWFDYLRVAFREVLKRDDKARAAFQFHIWEKIEGMPGKLDDALNRLERLDQALDQLFAHVRWLVEAVDAAYHQARQHNQHVLRSAFDQHRAVLAAHEKLNAALSALTKRIEFFHRDFEVTPVRVAKQMQAPQDSLETFLLRPEARAIPLTGRTREFRALWDWVHCADALSVCVIGVGPGAGKTRLGFELLLALQRQKNGDDETTPPWRIGRVAIGTLRQFNRNKDWAQWTWDRPTVIMVDYALEALDALQKWVDRVTCYARECNDRDEPCPPLRILLIEREASAKHLQQRLAENRPQWFSPREAPMSLRAIGDPALRISVLQSAMQVVAAKQHAAVPVLAADDETQRLLMGDDFRQPLYLMMAAWEAVQRGSVRDALRLGQSKLVKEMALRERQRIERYAGGTDDGRASRCKMLHHFAAYATLCRGLSASEVVEAARQELAAAGLTHSFDAPTLADALAAAQGEPDVPNAIAPVRPDIVGERFLYAWLNAARNAQERIALITRAVRQTPQALQTLFRMTADLPVTEARMLDGWLHEVLQHWHTNEPDLLQQFHDALPLYHSGLVGVAAVAAEALAGNTLSTLDASLSATASDADLAESAGKLDWAGIRLSEAGRKVEALAMSEEAVKIRRALYERNPEAYGNDLAGSLDNLGIRLSQLDRKPEALAMSEEAVKIRRALYERNPEAYGNNLAGSLGNLSVDLSQLDRKPEALQVVTEGLRVIAAPLQRNPVVHAEVARWLHRQYVSLAAALAQPLDEALLASIAVAIDI
jgi:Tetratricopeptide repeat